MSGHDNSVSGQGTPPFGDESFHFDPSLQVETEWQEDPFWREILANMSSNDLYSAANGPMQTAAGGMNSDQANNQADQVTFTSPSAQIPGAEPILNMPLANANQANDQLFPAQTSQLMSSPSPINPYYVPGMDNNPTWSPTGEGQPILPQPYPFTYSQGEYPTSVGGQFLAGAGAGAIDLGSNFQVPTTENGSLDPQLQGGSFDVSKAADRSSSPNFTAPPGLNTFAPKPAPEVGLTAPTNQISTDDAKPTPPPVAPTKKETNVKKTAVRNRPTTSKANQPAVKFPLDNSKVLVTSLDAAKQVAITRVKLEVVNDDHEDVAAHIGEWTLKVAKAIEVDFRTQAEDHERLTEEGRAEFTRWQKEHENKVWDALKESEEVPNPSAFAQACALIFCKRILEAHKLGSLEDPGKAVENNNSDVNMKCSERINAAINAIEEYSIVKYDLLKLERLEPLLASPTAFCSRKISNMWVNYKKKPGSGPVKFAVDGKDSVAAPRAKSQSKRKRNAPFSPASEDEGEDESGGEFVETSKRTRRT